ncbi:Non-specific serine/threonine protein kinase [Bertholletia excelsa]
MPVGSSAVISSFLAGFCSFLLLSTRLETLSGALFFVLESCLPSARRLIDQPDSTPMPKEPGSDTTVNSPYAATQNTRVGKKIRGKHKSKNKIILKDLPCFINISCGLPEGSNSTDNTTGLTYISDAGLVDSGTNMSIAPEYKTSDLAQYKDDIYDRVWVPDQEYNSTTISTSSPVKPNIFRPPSTDMSTANTNNTFDFYWYPKNESEQYFFFWHFAELEVLPPDEIIREFNIYVNGELCEGPFRPKYLETTTVYKSRPITSPTSFKLCLSMTNNSTLLAIINALEVYEVIQLGQVKNRRTRCWQADPCVPREYIWAGLECSDNASNPRRIISLDLSSSGLTGEIDPSFSNLTTLRYLDLSMNNLTGQNLTGNNFTGPLPIALLEKTDDGIMPNTTNPSPNAPWKKYKFIIPVSVLASALLVLIVIFAFTSWYVNKKRKQESKIYVLTSVKDYQVTNNFQRVIGKGGFGTVYHGYVGGSRVAVKMLSSSSNQGYKEFQAEAKVLTTVHHKNLTDLIGYCYEGTPMGLIYEYMANGSLDKHLLGLEYLHHGCKRAIIHRDVKCTNILLDEKFQAKLADFDLSKVVPVEGGTAVSTRVAGTAGYLDPEYYQSNRFTEKSNVYSFGIVLLEVIAGRLVLPKDQEDAYIVPWVESMIAKGYINGIVNSRLQGIFDVNSVKKALELAMACVSLSSTERPTMDYVVAELKECLAMVKAHHDVDSASGDATR